MSVVKFRHISIWENDDLHECEIEINRNGDIIDRLQFQCSLSSRLKKELENEIMGNIDNIDYLKF